MDNEDYESEEYDEELEKKKHWEKIRYRGGRPKIVYLKVRSEELCGLFNINKRTLSRWIDSGKLDPNDLKSICEKYRIEFRNIT